jgi:hypothetical protein
VELKMGTELGCGLGVAGVEEEKRSDLSVR